MSQQADQASSRSNVKLVTSVILLLAAFGFAAWHFAGETPADYARQRGFKCSECDHAYAYDVKSGDIEPLPCPECGKRAAYQAEMCYWAKGPNGDWIAKAEPTLVLLKRRVNPESNEATYCPDCGHEVVGHNPMPSDAQMMDAVGREGRD